MIDKEQIREIKQLFYTYRNGIIADNLRKAGDEHNIIFGLNIPQIQDISKSLPKSQELAQWLWGNDSTRESQLLAPLLYPIETFTKEVAIQWISTVPNHEIADNLCHKLLRKLPYAEELAWEFLSNKLSLDSAYMGLRLMLNLLILGNAIDSSRLNDVVDYYIQTDDNMLICKQIKDYFEGE